MKRFPNCICRTWGFNGWKTTKTKWGIRLTCPICGRLWGYLTNYEYEKQRELHAAEAQERERP